MFNRNDGKFIYKKLTRKHININKARSTPQDKKGMDAYKLMHKGITMKDDRTLRRPRPRYSGSRAFLKNERNNNNWTICIDMNTQKQQTIL